MPTPDAKQLAALEALKKFDPSLSVEWDEDTGTPVLLRGLLSPPSAPTASQSMADAAHQAAYIFLKQNKALFRLRDPDEEFPRRRVVSDELGSTVHFLQVYQGIEVLDGGLVVALDPQNRVTQVLGHYRPNLRLSTDPVVPVEQAIQTALANLEFTDKNLEPITHRLLIASTRSFPDVVAKLGKKNLLCWRIELLTWVSFVDARDGTVIFTYDNTQTARRRETYSTKDCRALPGTLWITESGAVAGQPVDDIAWAAHRHAGLVYDYYSSRFSLDSFDGRGHEMVSTVHSGINNGFTCDQNNAAFIPALNQIVYGDGDGSRFGPFAYAVDVTGHEFTHGVVYWAITWEDGSPRGLDYHDEPGALNESYADFFGNLIENKPHWLLGEDCYTPKTPGDALRDMEDPARYGQPDHYSKYVNSGTQSYRVHTNSGIMNKCAYLMSDGGIHHDITVIGMGREAAAKVWYRALKFHLRGASTFKESRPAMLQSCQEAFPGDALKYATVQNAFAAIGIGEAAPPAPMIAVEPSSIDFGSVTLSQSAEQALTVRNAGTADLSVSAVQVGQGPFSVSGEIAFQLTPGASKALAIKFLPTAIGQQQANLTLASNDSSRPTLSVPLSGSGAGVPRVAVEPISLDFGMVNVGQTAEQALTVRSTGTADLNVSAVQVAQGPFSISGETTFQLAPGTSRALTVRFSPTAGGQQQANLTITSNDSGQPALSVPLSGNGVRNPEITVEPKALDFGSAVVGDSAQLSLTVSNVGGTRLVVSGMRTDHSAFRVVGDTAFALEVGTARTVVIQFTPSVQGTLQATLSIVSNDPKSATLPVPLSGAGEPPPVGQPHIVLDVQQLDFGSVPVGQAARRSVTVRNNGTAALVVHSVRVDPPVYAIIGEATFSVEPSAAYAVIVQYKPTVQGAQRGTLTFTSNDPEHPEVLLALLSTSTSCFVATAAYGSPMQSQLRTLRVFRDQSLARSGLGRTLVLWYYGWSGPAGEWIAYSESRRAAARAVLRPFVALARLISTLRQGRSSRERPISQSSQRRTG